MVASRGRSLAVSRAPACGPPRALLVRLVRLCNSTHTIDTPRDSDRLMLTTDSRSRWITVYSRLPALRKQDPDSMVRFLKVSQAAGAAMVRFLKVDSSSRGLRDPSVSEPLPVS